ncbi:MAG: DHH family phosphoesterase [archaeon]|nr:DHH family phosphoesterase [archaeon]MCP8306257.1 DHH family phosphoesterase [archaeon]
MKLTSRRLKKFPLIEPKRLKDAVVICHRNADVDAYCSAYAVVHLIKQINPEAHVDVASPKGLDTLARRVQKEFNVEVTASLDISKADLVVVVDTGDLSLLESWGDQLRSTKSTRIFIDHHPLTESTKSVADLLLIDEDASSSSEIIYRLFKAKKAELGQDTAQALLLGILYDSRHLTIADCRTIKIVMELCRKGASLVSSRELLEMPLRKSEIIARMKAAQRLRTYRAKDLMIAVTNVRSFQASVANTLLGLGADMAFAVGGYGKGVRGSLRSTQSFYLKTGVHLGKDVAQKAASMLKGKGGGHPTAASLSSQCTIDEAITSVLSALSEKLQIKIKKLS